MGRLLSFGNGLDMDWNKKDWGYYLACWLTTYVGRFFPTHKSPDQWLVLELAIGSRDAGALRHGLTPRKMIPASFRGLPFRFMPNTRNGHSLRQVKLAGRFLNLPLTNLAEHPVGTLLVLGLSVFRSAAQCFNL